MSYREIIAAIRGNQKRIESETKIQAAIAYRLGHLIGFAVNQPKDYPSIHETYPWLFGAPIQKQQNWEVMKAKVEAYAAERRKRGVMENGDNT
jgi:hypothetical protein